MILVEICVGSSCFLKGSEEIIRLFEEALAREHLTDQVSLAGCLCLGKCNRVGVSIQVDDDIITGVTPANFPEFFREQIIKRVREEQ